MDFIVYKDTNSTQGNIGTNKKVIMKILTTFGIYNKGLANSKPH